LKILRNPRSRFSVLKIARRVRATGFVILLVVVACEHGPTRI
jgi:hypothetical protein